LNEVKECRIRQVRLERRLYRRDGTGADLLDRENPAGAELSARNYSDESIGKVLGDNMMRVLTSVLP
jgi:hypothetical protein